MASPSVGSMRTSSPMSRRTMAVWGLSASGANVFVEDVQLRDSVERFSKLNPAAANAPNDMAPPPMTRMVAMTSNVFLPLDMSCSFRRDRAGIVALQLDEQPLYPVAAHQARPNTPMGAHRSSMATTAHSATTTDQMAR